MERAEAVSETLAKVLTGMGSPRILVIGDMILDRYVWGEASRISQEAPIPILNVRQKEWRPGGAGNVVNALSHLGAQVTACGVVGGDDDGHLLARCVQELSGNRSCIVVDPQRPTTVKTRFVGYVQSARRAPHHVLRVDEEVTTPVAGEIEREMLDFLANVVGDQDCVICEDYEKGVLTEAVLAEIASLARSAGVPVLVDPKLGRPYRIYAGATALVPNRYEARVATGIEITDEAAARKAAASLVKDLALEHCLIKLDRDGMYLYSQGGRGTMIPTRPRDVYDVTGAGDIVVAVFAALLASGAKPEEAAQLANVAAGIEVGKFGCAPVYREEMLHELRSLDQRLSHKLYSLEALCSALQQRRSRGEKIAFTNGCFDLLHQGHIELIKFARRQGDLLVVAMNSDSSVRKLKGPSRPILGQEERAGVLAALGDVDYIVLFDSTEVTPVIEAVRPDVLVKGGDYRPDQVVGHEIVESHGGKVMIAPLVKGISTTDIVERVMHRYGNRDQSGPARRAEEASQ